MSNNKRLLNTIVISVLAVFISYLINYFLTSYITDHVGIEAYGFVSIAKTAVSYANIITIALTNFTVRFIAVSYHEKKLKEAQEYYSSSILANAILSIAIFLVALVAIWKLEKLLKIPEVLVVQVKLLFIIVFLNFIVTTMMTPFSTAAIIKNRLDVVNIIKIFSYCCDALVLMIMFKNIKPEVWFVGIGSLAASIVKFIGNVSLTKILTPELKFVKGLASCKRVKNIVSHGIYNSINSLGNVLNSGLDLIVSNLLLSGTATGQIAVVKSFTTMFAMVNSTIYQPLQPKLIESYSTGNIKIFVKELKKSMIICSFFSNVAFGGFVALGMLYYKLWLPNQDYTLLYSLTMISIVIYVTDGVLTPVYYINTLTLKNKVPCWVTIIGGVFNVLGMYILIKNTNLQAYAVVGTTTVIMLAINLFFNPIYAAWCLKISPKEIYEIIIKSIISVLFMTAVFVIIKNIFKPTAWITLIASAGVMVALGLVVHGLVMYSPKEIIYNIKAKAKK